MTKHKTKQQKIIAKLRRELTLKSKDLSSSYSTEKSIKNIESNQNQTQEKFKYNFSYANKYSQEINTYPYLKHDLLKTAILTGFIVGLEILLFISMKNHIFPGIQY